MQQTEFGNTSANARRARWQTPEVMALGRVADLARDDPKEPKGYGHGRDRDNGNGNYGFPNFPGR